MSRTPRVRCDLCGSGSAGQIRLKVCNNCRAELHRRTMQSKLALSFRTTIKKLNSKSTTYKSNLFQRQEYAKQVEQFLIDLGITETPEQRKICSCLWGILTKKLQRDV